MKTQLETLEVQQLLNQRPRLSIRQIAIMTQMHRDTVKKIAATVAKFPRCSEGHALTETPCIECHVRGEKQAA